MMGNGIEKRKKCKLDFVGEKEVNYDLDTPSLCSIRCIFM